MHAFTSSVGEQDHLNRQNAIIDEIKGILVFNKSHCIST